MKKKRTKILITNTVALNGGDAAILKGMLKILKASFGIDTEFTIYDAQAEVASRYYPGMNFRSMIYWQKLDLFGLKRPMRLIRKINRIRVQFGTWCWSHRLIFVAKIILISEELTTLAEYKSADLIVSTGGTYLIENYSLTARILDYKISLWLKKPLVFFTQSLGPFSNRSNRNTFKKIFDQACAILLRDFQSLEHLRQIGVQNRNIYVTPDAAFALLDGSSVSESRYKASPSTAPKIAISVRKWEKYKNKNPVLGQRNYLHAIRDLTIYLVDTYEADITFISTCQGIPEYFLDDSMVALDIVGMLSPRVTQAVKVDREFHTPEDLTEILKMYDMVVATRLHMAILSLGIGTPVIPIAYEFKTQELFNKLGQGKWIIDIEEIESTTLITYMDRFLNSLKEIRQDLIPTIQKEIEQVYESCFFIKQGIGRIDKKSFARTNEIL